MHFAPAITLRSASKCYQLFATPQDRLKQFLFGKFRQYYKKFWALREVSMEIHHGEVIGIIGRNGAGKSTLLQLVCGTLAPTSGEVNVSGRIVALLELGAGFNPEFTGRENIYLNAAILGMSREVIDKKFDDIVEFAEIGQFIDQPVKTYSSGMYVRLAFSIAISVEPDILVIDEALSVGDGAFSRKSFDRIMQLRSAGKTILFCSHSMYQVEAICNRVFWLDGGCLRLEGDPAYVVAKYNAFLAMGHFDANTAAQVNSTAQLKQYDTEEHPAELLPTSLPAALGPLAHIVNVQVAVDGISGKHLVARTGQSDLKVSIQYKSNTAYPTPSVAVSLHAPNGQVIASSGTQNDKIELQRNPHGEGAAHILFPCLPLLKGDYNVSVWLLCERALMVYDHAELVATIQVEQSGLEQGFVSLRHHWTTHE